MALSQVFISPKVVGNGERSSQVEFNGTIRIVYDLRSYRTSYIRQVTTSRMVCDTTTYKDVITTNARDF